jgi:hypothetical protein
VLDPDTLLRADGIDGDGGGDVDDFGDGDHDAGDRQPYYVVGWVTEEGGRLKDGESSRLSERSAARFVCNASRKSIPDLKMLWVGKHDYGKAFEVILEVRFTGSGAVGSVSGVWLGRGTTGIVGQPTRRTAFLGSID